MSDGALIVRNIESMLTVSDPTMLHSHSNIAKHKPKANSFLLAMIYDAKRFILRYGSIIEQAPLQTDCAALAFSSLKSEIRR
jgi:hypothetical protein